MGRKSAFQLPIRTLVQDFVSIMCEPAGPALRLLVQRLRNPAAYPDFSFLAATTQSLADREWLQSDGHSQLPLSCRAVSRISGEAKNSSREGHAI
jgi:hypothetical protein